MKLETKYLGVVEIEKEKILRFPNGLPGFPEENDFVILNLPNNSAFQLLQSVNTKNLAFVITNPYLFKEDYTLSIEDTLIDTLEIKKEEEVVIYSIITVKNPFEESMLNLRAPIIINSTNRKAKQYIINESIYSSRTPITANKKGVG